MSAVTLFSQLYDEVVFVGHFPRVFISLLGRVTEIEEQFLEMQQKGNEFKKPDGFTQDGPPLAETIYEELAVRGTVSKTAISILGRLSFKEEALNARYSRIFQDQAIQTDDGPPCCVLQDKETQTNEPPACVSRNQVVQNDEPTRRVSQHPATRTDASPGHFSEKPLIRQPVPKEAVTRNSFPAQNSTGICGQQIIKTNATPIPMDPRLLRKPVNPEPLKQFEPLEDTTNVKTTPSKTYSETRPLVVEFNHPKDVPSTASDGSGTPWSIRKIDVVRPDYATAVVNSRWRAVRTGPPQRATAGDTLTAHGRSSVTISENRSPTPRPQDRNRETVPREPKTDLQKMSNDVYSRLMDPASTNSEDVPSKNKAYASGPVVSTPASPHQRKNDKNTGKECTYCKAHNLGRYGGHTHTECRKLAADRANGRVKGAKGKGGRTAKSEEGNIAEALAYASGEPMTTTSTNNNAFVNSEQCKGLQAVAGTRPRSEEDVNFKALEEKQDLLIRRIELKEKISIEKSARPNSHFGSVNTSRIPANMLVKPPPSLPTKVSAASASSPPRRPRPPSPKFVSPMLRELEKFGVHPAGRGMVKLQRYINGVWQWQAMREEEVEKLQQMGICVVCSGRHPIARCEDRLRENYVQRIHGFDFGGPRKRSAGREFEDPDPIRRRRGP